MSLIYSQTDTNYTELSTRWGNTPTTTDVCVALSTESLLQSDEPNYNLVSDRWNQGVPYFKVQNLGAVSYIFECTYVDRIDGYMVSECSASLLRSELEHFNDFIRYQDLEITRADLVALNDLLVSMVLTGNDCNTLQGASCG